jgi:hypothetical protein
MEKKICVKCSEEKLLGEYPTYNYKGLIKYKNTCKVCESEYNKIYRETNKKIIEQQKKEWYDKNKESVIDKQKNHRLLNPDKYKIIDSERYIQNKEQILEKNKIYYENNKDKIKQYKKDWAKENEQHLKEKRKQYWNDNKIELNKKQYQRKKERLKNDTFFKFKTNVRSLIYNSFYRKSYIKQSKSFEILGCSFEELKQYLESKFESWMTWENRGLYNGELNYGWDIDHIIPTSSATTEEELIKLNHYTNLQPLCSKINRDIKKNKVD